MIFHRNYFLNTTAKVDVLSIIHEINRTIRESNAKQGLVNIMVSAPGGAVTIIEMLPDLIEKLKEAARIFPGEGSETKDKRKEDVSIYPRVAAAMLGKTICIPFKDEKLMLGMREEPVLVDFETGGKRRELHVLIFGEGGEDEGQKAPPNMRGRG